MFADYTPYGQMAEYKREVNLVEGQNMTMSNRKKNLLVSAFSTRDTRRCQKAPESDEINFELRTQFNNVAMYHSYEALRTQGDLKSHPHLSRPKIDWLCATMNITVGSKLHGSSDK